MVTSAEIRRTGQGVRNVGAPPAGSQEWIDNALIEQQKKIEKAEKQKKFEEEWEEKMRRDEFRQVEETRKQDEKNLKNRARAMGAAKATLTAVAGAGSATVRAGTKMVAQPVKGIKGLFLNIVPENEIGVYVLLIMLVYWTSWMFNFTGRAVIGAHATLALIGFTISTYVDQKLGNGLWQSARRNGMTFSILLLVDYMLLSAGLKWNLLLIVALLWAFKEGKPVEDFKRVAVVMVLSAMAYYVYSRNFNLLLPAIANFNFSIDFGLGLTNFGPLAFFLALLANRAVTYPFFWYAIFGLSSQTRVARSMAWIMMFAFIFAMWPQISPEVNQLRSEYGHGTTAEQKGQVTGFFKSAVANAGKAVGSFGDWLQVRKAYAEENLAESFGFGTAKEQPKMGLKLSSPEQKQKFDLEDKMPVTPLAVLNVPEQFPPEFPPEKRVIDITGIECTASSEKGLANGKVIEPELPFHIFHGSLATAKCEFDEVGKLKEGSNTMEMVVKYNFKADSDMSTTFMPDDIVYNRQLGGEKIEEIVAKGKIAAPKASYDNFPISLTWDNEFGNPIVGFKTKQSVGIYVAKSGTWQGEIYGINSLKLVLPEGFELIEGDRCSFGPKGSDGAYPVKKQLIIKNELPKFIGDGKLFSCDMKIDPALFDAKGNIVPATFKAIGDFTFGTKENIQFDIKGTPPAAPAGSEAAKS